MGSPEMGNGERALRSRDAGELARSSRVIWVKAPDAAGRPAEPFRDEVSRACVGLGRFGCCARPRDGLRDFATPGVRAAMGIAPGQRVGAGRAARSIGDACAALAEITTSVRGGAKAGQGWRGLSCSPGATAQLAAGNPVRSVERAAWAFG